MLSQTPLVESLGSACPSLSVPTKGLGSSPLNFLPTAPEGSSPARCAKPLEQQIYSLSLCRQCSEETREVDPKKLFGNKLTIKELCGLGVGARGAPPTLACLP